MLLYLTSNENLGLFDFLTDELGMIIKKLSGDFYLKKFVIHDARNLSHYSHIAIDLEAIKDDQDEIIDSFMAFKAMYDARIILLAEKTDQIFLDRILQETEIYNIITGQTIEKIQEEIRICTTPQGMSKEYLLKAISFSMDEDLQSYPQYSYIGEDIKIMIAGSMTRIGTTTAAMNMASYLASIGAKVSYTEANEHEHLEKIHSYFCSNIPIENDSFQYGGVDYYFNSNLPIDHNFNIIDLGVLTKNNVPVFNIGDVKILCGGVKPYEIPHLISALELVPEDTKIILPIGEKQEARKTLQTDKELHFAHVSSNLFDPNINTEVWRSILSKYIVEHRTL